MERRLVPSRKGWRLAVVLGGIVLGQLVLYGQSLTGNKIMLPLDILSHPGIYTPRTGKAGDTRDINRELVDLVLSMEPTRRFIGAELRAGRLALWNPHQFAGSRPPWPLLSPLWLLRAIVPSPVAIPWVALLAALVGGMGMYRFCRRALLLSFWPSSIAAWAFPLTAFIVLWQGFPTAQQAVWLPWLLLAVHRTAYQRRRGAGIGLAVVTCLILLSGQLDIAGELLLFSALFGGYCVLSRRRRLAHSRQHSHGHNTLWAGWLAGLLLAAPAILPVLEYSRSGARMERRSAGSEERPPIGLAALPQVILPRIWGSLLPGSVSVAPKGQGNTLESSAAAYAGLIATLFMAPLAWCSRRHRPAIIFWTVAGFVGLSWCLNVPGLVSLFRLPGLRMLSYNRLTFGAGFAVVCIAAIGLDSLWRRRAAWRSWHWAPVAILAGLGIWSTIRRFHLPHAFAVALAKIHDETHLQTARAWLDHSHTIAVLLCVAALGAWLTLRIWKRSRWLFVLVSTMWLAELVEFDLSRDFQSDASAYYPRLPVLDALAKDDETRVVGFDCLPASLATMTGLRDVRGYDGVFPSRIMALLHIAAIPEDVPEYMLAQFMAPRVSVVGGTALLSPVLDMLSVRYVLFRGSPPPGLQPSLSDDDYWVLTNPRAMPRAFIPSHVENLTSPRERLQKLASKDFDPRQIAYVESPVELSGPARGSVAMAEDTPWRITLLLAMETPGLVVLSDLWDVGWHAYLDDDEVSVLRTNHAVRGVVVPAGARVLRFQYEPATFFWGLRLSALTMLVLLVWLGLHVHRSRDAEAESTARDQGTTPSPTAH